MRTAYEVTCPDCNWTRLSLDKHAARCIACSNKGRFRPVTCRTLCDVESAWLGAMIEGEGTIGFNQGKYVTVNVTNTEVETIATCLRVTGTGTVQSHRSEEERHQRVWRWYLNRRLDVLYFLEQIYPYLTGKSERASTAIVWLRQLERKRQQDYDKMNPDEVNIHV